MILARFQGDEKVHEVVAWSQHSGNSIEFCFIDVKEIQIKLYSLYRSAEVIEMSVRQDLNPAVYLKVVLQSYGRTEHIGEDHAKHIVMRVGFRLYDLHDRENFPKHVNCRSVLKKS